MDKKDELLAKQFLEKVYYRLSDNILKMEAGKSYSPTFYATTTGEYKLDLAVPPACGNGYEATLLIRKDGNVPEAGLVLNFGGPDKYVFLASAQTSTLVSRLYEKIEEERRLLGLGNVVRRLLREYTNEKEA